MGMFLCVCIWIYFLVTKYLTNIDLLTLWELEHWTNLITTSTLKRISPNAWRQIKLFTVFQKCFYSLARKWKWKERERQKWHLFIGEWSLERNISETQEIVWKESKSLILCLQKLRAKFSMTLIVQDQRKIKEWAQERKKWKVLG